jgi:beta-lysine 5,6-aminomutase beta subunit
VAEIVPYGDTAGDGMVQLSFTLPIPADARAREVGLEFLRRNGLRDPQIVHIGAADREMAFFVAYARAAHGVDPDAVVGSEVEAPALGFTEVNALIERELGRPIVVIGAAIESDAHTVGIDAIMNMKGFAGDYGLERYPWIEAVNLGAQVPCERVLREAQERSADAILVSQVVTQKQVHARQLTKLVDLLEAEGVRDRYVLVCGGPRLSNTFARSSATTPASGPARPLRRWPDGSRRSWWPEGGPYDHAAQRP